MGRTARSASVTRLLVCGAGHGIDPADLAPDGSERRERRCKPGIESRLCGGTGRGAPRAPADPGSKWIADAYVSADTIRGGLDDLRLGREVSGGVGVERCADALEVSLHRLVYAFGERKVGDSVVYVEQQRRLGVDRGRFLAGARAEASVRTDRWPHRRNGSV